MRQEDHAAGLDTWGKEMDFVVPAPFTVEYLLLEDASQRGRAFERRCPTVPEENAVLCSLRFLETRNPLPRYPRTLQVGNLRGSGVPSSRVSSKGRSRRHNAKSRCVEGMRIDCIALSQTL